MMTHSERIVVAGKEICIPDTFLAHSFLQGQMVLFTEKIRDTAHISRTFHVLSLKPAPTEYREFPAQSSLGQQTVSKARTVKGDRLLLTEK